MPKQDIVVVGASAGGVEALQLFAASLPSDLPGAVFIVLHIGSGGSEKRSHLPAILPRAGRLAAAHPRGGDPIEKGRIYVAPPDCHSLVAGDRVKLSRGPKENRTRPDRNNGLIAGGVAVIEDPSTMPGKGSTSIMSSPCATSRPLSRVLPGRSATPWRKRSLWKKSDGVDLSGMPRPTFRTPPGKNCRVCLPSRPSLLTARYEKRASRHG